MTHKPPPGTYRIVIDGVTETLEIDENGANLPPAEVWFWIPWNGPPMLGRLTDDGSFRMFAFMDGGELQEFVQPQGAPHTARGGIYVPA